MPKPINYREVVPVGGLRQANCYYSSSDADFSTRYEVNEHYDDLLAGKVTVNGGWRIYSSGPGIFIRLVVGLFFGVRRQFGATIIDPVMPSEFDGCRLQTKLCGKLVELVYHVSANSGPTRIVVNGGAVSFERESNTYRTGGAVISDDVLCSVLTQKKNTIEIHV
jgi:cellobiose phosphorylase